MRLRRRYINSPECSVSATGPSEKQVASTREESSEPTTESVPVTAPADTPEEESGAVPIEEQQPAGEPEDEALEGSEEEAPQEETEAQPMAEEEPLNRDIPVTTADGSRTYPAPSRYDVAHWKDNPELLAEAPWFCLHAIEDGTVIPKYDNNSWLTEDIPTELVGTWAWRSQFACYDTDLVTGYNRTLFSSRSSFAKSALGGYSRLKTFHVFTDNQSCGGLARTNREVPYVDALCAIPVNLIEGWQGQERVAMEAYVYDRPQLLAEFRYVRNTGAYWEGIRDERRFRSRLGRAVPYQCLVLFGVRNTFTQRAYAGLTRFWSRIEVPRGSSAELPSVFTHRMRELMDPNSGWSVVAYTEMVAKTAAFVLMDAYHNYRLWALSPDSIEGIRALDLVRVLGNQANADECLKFLDIIEATNFAREPAQWRARQSGLSLSTGRRGAGADWIYFDPWVNGGQGARCSVEHTRRECRIERDIPDGHPMGWDYGAIPEGWQAGDDLGDEEEDGLADDFSEDGNAAGTPAPVGDQAQALPAIPPSVGDPPVAASSAAPADEMVALRGVLRRIGGIPESVTDGTEDAIFGYLAARLA